MNIFYSIPFYVWPLLIFALFGGLRALKTHYTPLRILAMVPLIFLVWSLSGYLKKYGADVSASLVWLGVYGIGAAAGYALLRKTPLKFHHEKKGVEMPGSLLPLFLVSTIFSSKFALGMLGGFYPELNGSFALFLLELLSVLILGVFCGRALCCFSRYFREKRDG